MASWNMSSMHQKLEATVIETLHRTSMNIEKKKSA